MSGFKEQGVCGIDPIIPNAYQIDSLFPTRQNCFSGSLCSFLNGRMIEISVFNSYDSNEGVECYLKILKNSKLVFFTKINKEESLNYKVELPAYEQLANYVIVIYSPAGYGKIDTRDDLDLETGIKKSLFISPNQSIVASFSISRRESILHDFLIDFHVAENATTNSGKLAYELDSMIHVAKHRLIVKSEADKLKVDADLVKAIMYTETTHGYCDTMPALFGKKSILPMNVRSDYWKDVGFNYEKLKKISNNIEAEIFLIKQLSDRVKPYSIDRVASLYQNLGAIKVTNYGARVQEIYNKKLWVPDPGLLDKINMKVNQFEQLPPVDQINILRRLFGAR